MSSLTSDCASYFLPSRGAKSKKRSTVRKTNEKSGGSKSPRHTVIRISFYPFSLHEVSKQVVIIILFRPFSGKKKSFLQS